MAEELQIKPGHVDGRYRFKGGDPNKKENWEEIESQFHAGMQSALGTAVETSPAVGGAMLGGAYGSALGPLGTAAGVILGGGAGWLMGNTARKQLSEVEGPLTGKPMVTSSLEDVPEANRPAAIAGEVVGGSVPYAMLPFHPGMATMPSKILSGIGETAQRYPKSTAISEVLGIGGAAAGGGGAEYLWPGDTYARMASEAVGGMLSPGRVLAGAGRGGVELVRRGQQMVSRSAREDEAARVVQTVVDMAGEDPDKIVRTLRHLPMPKVRGTTGQMSGSRGLLAMENSLAKYSEQFSREAEDYAEGALRTLRQNAEILAKSGDPAALKAAADERQRYFTSLLQGRVLQAEERAIEAANALSPKTTRTDLSLQMDRQLDSALRQARQAEREMWAQVDRSAEGATDNILTAYGRIRGELLPEEGLPAIVEGWVRRHSPNPETGEMPDPPSMGELITLRSRMLAKAREAADKREWTDARIYGEIAEAALDDLDVSAVDPSYHAARDFSRSLNDVFTRSLAGNALDTGPFGRRKIPPELIASWSFSGGRERGALRFGDLKKAMEFMPSMEAGGEEQLVQMLDAQEQFLRYAASEMTDPNTGRVNPDRLAKFRRDNAEMLAEFPETMALLGNAEDAERMAANVLGTANRAQQRINEAAAFVRVAGRESPEAAIGSALSGKNPVREMTQLARLARREGPQAVSGMRSAVLKMLMDSATDSQGNFNWGRFRHALVGKTLPNNRSMMSFLRREGLMDNDQAENLLLITDEAIKRMAAVQERMTAGEAMESADMLTNIVARIAGANIGGMGAVGGSTGAPLVASYVGSQSMQRVLEKIPAARTKDILIEASRNPHMMESLLVRPVTPGQKFRLGRQMNAFLWYAGINEPLRELPPTETEQTP